jgi:hypothetical protein
VSRPFSDGRSSTLAWRLFDPFVKALPRSFTTEIVRYPPNRCLTSSELLHLLGFHCLRFRAVCAHSGIVLLTSGISVGGYQSDQPERIGNLRRIHDQLDTWGASINLPAPVALLFPRHSPCECNQAIVRWARCAILAGGCCKVCDLIGKTGGALPPSPHGPDL